MCPVQKRGGPLVRGSRGLVRVSWSGNKGHEHLLSGVG